MGDILNTGLCRLCLYAKGVALLFILFGPDSSFQLADHPASVRALSLAAGCRNRISGSLETAPFVLVAGRYKFATSALEIRGIHFETIQK